MEKYLDRVNQFFEQVPDWVRKYRVAVWTIFFLANVVILSGVSWFKIDMTLESYFQQDDPVKRAYDRFRAQFGSDEIIFLIYEAKDGDIFSNNSLQAVKRIQNELLNYRLTIPADQPSELDHIIDVTSIVNADYMESQGGDLLARHFIGDQLPQTEAERETLRQMALAHPSYPGLYISDDSRFGAIVIKTDFGAYVEEDIVISTESTNDLGSAERRIEIEAEEFDDETIEVDMESEWNDVSELMADQTPKFHRMQIDDYGLFMREFQPILEKKDYTDHLKFYPVGNAPVMNFFEEVVFKDLLVISVASLLLIVAVLWILFRSVSAVIWPVVVVVVSFLWVVGLIGWSGVIMTMMINIIAFLILAVGVADAIHILSGYLFFRQQNQDHETALRSVFKKSGLACFLTSFTTAIGLFSLVLVPIVPVRNFGIFAALGVEIAFLITVFILPLMLDLWAPVAKNVTLDDGRIHPLQRLLRMVEHVGYDYAKTVIVIFTILSVLLLIAGSGIKVNSNFVEILPPGSLIRQSVNIADEKLNGSQNFEILLDAGQADAFKDPDLLNRMAELEEYLYETYPELVGKTTSLVDIAKSSYKALHDNDPAKYIIPQEQEVLAQTLFLYNNANPKNRRLFVSDDYSQARFTVSAKNQGTYIYSPFVEDIQNKVDTLFDSAKDKYPDLNVQLTGGMSLMCKLLDYISWSQIKSFGLALTVISVLLLIVFGSVKIGIIALFPNLMPIVFVFGVMGFFGISLDTDTLLIAPLIIGIAIDDTIHFLTHYRAGLRAGSDINGSIRLTVREAGQAIMFTSLVLSIGFLTFMFSQHMSMRNFGVLSSLAIMLALVTDLLLLPALFKVTKADFGRSKRYDTGSSTVSVES